MPTTNEPTQKVMPRKTKTTAASDPFRHIKTVLKRLGFSLSDTRQPFDDEYFYASYGNGRPHILFMTTLYGTPTNNTKPCPASEANHTALGCFVSACKELLTQAPLNGTISIFVQNKNNFNRSLNLHYIFDRLGLLPQSVDFCLIGEPGQSKKSGQEINIGSLGSILFTITSFNTSENITTPETSGGAVQNLLNLLYKIKSQILDGGNGYFSSSTVQVIKLETIPSHLLHAPEQASATLLVHYNDSHTPQKINRWMQNNINFSNGCFQLSFEPLSAPYISNIVNEIPQLKQILPLNTHYGTNCTGEFSDFIKNYCSFAELGLMLKNNTVNFENSLELQNIYFKLLCHYLNQKGIS